MVFLPSTRYGSLRVETSYQPSRSLRSATYFPQSEINPFSLTTFAPNAWHSITFAEGVSAGITMTADTPSANVMQCQAFGAKVVKLNGLISDCGKYVAERKDREGWYDVSTLKEP